MRVAGSKLLSPTLFLVDMFCCCVRQILLFLWFSASPPMGFKSIVLSICSSGHSNRLRFSGNESTGTGTFRSPSWKRMECARNDPNLTKYALDGVVVRRQDVSDSGVCESAGVTFDRRYAKVCYCIYAAVASASFESNVFSDCGRRDGGCGWDIVGVVERVQYNANLKLVGFHTFSDEGQAGRVVVVCRTWRIVSRARNMCSTGCGKPSMHWLHVQLYIPFNRGRDELEYVSILDVLVHDYNKGSARYSSVLFWCLLNAPHDLLYLLSSPRILRETVECRVNTLSEMRTRTLLDRATLSFSWFQLKHRWSFT